MKYIFYYDFCAFAHKRSLTGTGMIFNFILSLFLSYVCALLKKIMIFKFSILFSFTFLNLLFNLIVVVFFIISVLFFFPSCFCLTVSLSPSVSSQFLFSSSVNFLFLSFPIFVSYSFLPFSFLCL